ncbi:hypothetical protein HSX11_02895 [Oxalobacteraceae bacterium]|nr:hypothetical protein [Oxalobacteraceae bacterium]
MQETPDTVVDIPPSPEAKPLPVPPPKKSGGKWKRYLLYTLAAIGLAGIALFAFVGYKVNKEKAVAVRVSIDETEMIDGIMSRTYGKYSEQKKGWLYVADGDRTYLVRVVQQSKTSDGPDGDELYFVTSGTPTDGEEGSLYGVFQVRGATNATDGSMVEISSPYRYDSNRPITPENVHFEALSENVWAWVIKTSDGKSPKAAPVHTTNMVFASHGETIVELASFKAGVESEPAGDCAAALGEYELWLNETKVAAAEAAAKGEEDEMAGEEVDNGPMRCEKTRWSYRTAPVTGPVPGPLSVTLKGSRDGKPVEEKTWKLMFDSKAFSYNVPAELVPD